MLSGIASARQVTSIEVDQLLEDAAFGGPGGGPPEVDPDLGLDRLAGGDPGEVEVDDLLAQVVPLDLADQDGLRAPPPSISSSARWVCFLIIPQTDSLVIEIGVGACLWP